MKTVAFLTASQLLIDPDIHADDVREMKLELEAVIPACKQRGIRLDVLAWDDPELDDLRHDGIVVGTCWDYVQRTDEFHKTMRRLDQSGRLLNPASTLIWNSDKAYLRDLATKKVATIPTIWADKADTETINGAFETLGCDEIIIKPRIGAHAWRQARLKKGNLLPAPEALPPAACLIQPFLSAAETEGELTLLFFDRIVSHALIKKPAKGDYRSQASYGATETPTEPDDDALKIAHAALNAVDGDLLYARVDLMRGMDGGWKIMELELIEPYYYPEQGPHCGAHFAAALDRLLSARA